ncbi:hypothetical protein GIB67_014541 [Kingdonia uniflora]|uniref:Uncharacterized protein n=1 Tax=Kingdonia uniflora TaxID=39325 RepID=A0A7J7LKB5_9MAGN|nr:hypothetical protein GIB67_014541 [Kingdonia uniflora]
MIMEKSKSFPEYSSSYSERRFSFEDGSNRYSFNGPSCERELKRRKRLASYNSFLVEERLKSSVKNSFKWIKTKFTEIRYGA